MVHLSERFDGVMVDFLLFTFSWKMNQYRQMLFETGAEIPERPGTHLSRSITAPLKPPEILLLIWIELMESTGLIIL